MLINLFRRYIFDKKGRLSVIRIWTFPNFYYLTDFKKLSVLFVYLDLFPYHCTAWVVIRMPIHCDPANTYSSFKSVMFLKALPFNPVMSLSFRRLRYLPNKLINSVKIPLKFIAQGRGITETIINVLPIWQKFALLS